MDTKQCSRCKKMLPATTEYFFRYRRSKDGLAYWCKDCKGSHEAKVAQSGRKREYNKAYYKQNRERILQRSKDYHHAHPEKQVARQRKYYAANKDVCDNRSKANARRIRLEIIAAYGGKCECCGEERIEFLAIDHINGGGRRHRKSLSGNFYRWLKRNNFPEGFRVLCHNCNSALGFYGYCPHKQSKD